MNLLDILIIAVMILFIVRGILRGIIREIASLAGMILGIWLANFFQPQMTEYLRSYLPNSQFLPLISFALIFTAVLALSNFLGWLFKLLLKKTFFGWADRTLGAGLATVKGVILIYLVIVIVTFFLPAKTPLIAKSRLAPLIIASYQSMVRLVSPDHYKNWKRKIMGKKEKMSDIVSEKIEDLTK